MIFSALKVVDVHMRTVPFFRPFPITTVPNKHLSSAELTEYGRSSGGTPPAPFILRHSADYQRSLGGSHGPILTEHKRSSGGADDKKQLLIFIGIVIKVHFPACRSQKYTNQSYKLKETGCELRPAPFKLRDTPAFDGAQTEFRRS